MTESDFWKYIRQGLTGRAHLTRIESSAGNGVPDVSIGLPKRNAWIELKYIRYWPKRPSTKLRLPLRPEQRLWITARGSLSGDVWVLCRVDTAIFLLTSQQAAEACDGWVSAQWYSNATKYWTGGKIEFTELLNALNGQN